VIENDTVADLEGAVARYLEGTGAQPGAGFFAVAGPIDGEDVALTNRGWRFRRSAKLIPPAKIPTTMATGVRVPRITGFPWQTLGSMTIRSFIAGTEAGDPYAVCKRARGKVKPIPAR
jgi:hypothetical protein